jgi:hypothetical protein
MKISQAFTECGSDKNTRHSYGPFYDRITDLNKIRSVLEIGIYKGWSLSAWRTHDSTIRLLGVDQERRCKFPMIITTTPDYSPVVCYCRENNLTFDLIIDDGSHDEDSQALGLYYLREFLSPSGVYVIEDLRNQEAVDRMSRMDGSTILDFRTVKGQDDDVLAVWTNPEGKI